MKYLLIEIRLSPLRQFFLAMRVKHQKLPYLYKECEKVLKLIKKESHTVKNSIKCPKKAIFGLNNLHFKDIFLVKFFVFRSYLDQNL
jgi:hypothetical protein